MNPNSTAEMSIANQVPNDCSTMRNTMPRNTISSATPAIIAPTSGPTMLDAAAVPVTR
jgi:hypothetical protein